MQELQGASESGSAFSSRHSARLTESESASATGISSIEENSDSALSDQESEAKKEERKRLAKIYSRRKKSLLR